MLFVCTANVTRSPASAAIFKTLAAKTGEKWDVASAGVRAGTGMSAYPVMSFAIRDRLGISLSDHKSQRVDAKLLKRYHWIFALERAHRDAMVKLEPTAADRIFVLRDFGRTPPLDNPDMPDPTGKDAEEYGVLLDILSTEIPRLLRVIQDRIADLEMESE